MLVIKKVLKTGIIYLFKIICLFIEYNNSKLTVGLNVFNLFDIKNPIDVYPETGDAKKRSDYFTQNIGLPEEGKSLSNSFYDTPWHFSSPREINFFIRIDYK